MNKLTKEKTTLHEWSISPGECTHCGCYAPQLLLAGHNDNDDGPRGPAEYRLCDECAEIHLEGCDDC